MGLFDGTIGSLWVKLGLDSQDFDSKMAKTKANLTQWRDDTNAHTKDMAKWGAAIGATVGPIIAVTAAVRELQMEYGNMAQQLKDVSYTTGLTTQKLQELKWAAIISGTSFDRVTFSISNLNLKMAEAADETTKAYKAFSLLGINTEGKTPDEVFEEVASALERVEDTAVRDTLANELLGKSWRDMLPFIVSYRQNKEKIAEKPTFSDDDLKRLERAKTAWDDLSQSIYIAGGELLIFMNRYGGGYMAGYEAMYGEGSRPTEAPAFTHDLQISLTDLSSLLDDNSKSLKTLGDEAEKSQRKMEDLAQSIVDTRLSMQGTGMEQRDLGEKFNTLTEEKRINDLKISAQPDSSEARDLRARNKEIEKELERIGYQMSLNNQSLGKDLTQLQRDNQDLAEAAIATDQKILDSLQTRVEVTKTQNDTLNQLSHEHWQTEAGMAQVTYQAIVDYAAEAVNFAGSHPVIQKIVRLSSTGYDIDPSPLPMVIAPTLKTTDFSNVLTKTPAVTPTEGNAEGATGGTGSGGNTTINLNQTNYGVPDNGVATNKALGLLAQQRGARGL